MKICQKSFWNFIFQIYMLYSLCQGLSSCLYQSLCDVENFCQSWTNQSLGSVDNFNLIAFFLFKYFFIFSFWYRILTRRPRFVSSNENLVVTTIPSKWPGVDSLVALLCREKGEETSHLRLLLVQVFVAVCRFKIISAYAFALHRY